MMNNVSVENYLVNFLGANINSLISSGVSSSKAKNIVLNDCLKTIFESIQSQEDKFAMKPFYQAMVYIIKNDMEKLQKFAYKEDVAKQLTKMQTTIEYLSSVINNAKEINQ